MFATKLDRPGGSAGHLQLLEDVTAHNYSPLPVVLSEGRGAWVTDVEGRRSLDFLAGYSALNFGHATPCWWRPPATSWRG